MCPDEGVPPGVLVADAVLDIGNGGDGDPIATSWCGSSDAGC